MEINSKDAYEILMEAKKMNSEGRYIDHSLTVGEAASRIANNMNLNSDKAKSLGYIHDIGKRYGEPFTQHVAKGYEYLLDLGIDEEYANVCITHSYLNNDIDCTAGGVIDSKTYKYEFRKEFMKKHIYTKYEEIINLCDLMCTDKFMILEERLIEIMSRRGSDTNTQYHVIEALKLKNKIDEYLGYNLYTLFPEIETRIFERKLVR